MNRTKIEWVRNPDGSQGFTWNPVTGCLHGCSYCYARRIAKRFATPVGEYGHDCSQPPRPLHERRYKGGNPWPYGFAPTLHSFRLREPRARKKPAMIFVCSMADLFGKWVPAEWIESVLKTVRACPQHTFMFLTKNPERYWEFYFPGNCWLGATATDQESWDRAISYFSEYRNNDWYFISAEPLLRSINPRGMNEIDWLITGADSTRGAKKPERQWVMDLYNAARLAGVPVFMKDNLKPLLSALDLRREFPEVTNG